jgi:hypothetical protein
MLKVSKQQRQEFVSAIASLLESYGATPALDAVDYSNSRICASREYEIKTAIGAMRVRAYADNSPWIYVKFLDLEAARNRFGCTSHASRDCAFAPVSGKYNHHYIWEHSIETCVRDFERTIKRLGCHAPTV